MLNEASNSLSSFIVNLSLGRGAELQKKVQMGIQTYVPAAKSSKYIKFLNWNPFVQKFSVLLLA